MKIIFNNFAWYPTINGLLVDYVKCLLSASTDISSKKVSAARITKMNINVISIIHVDDEKWGMPKT